MVGNHWIGMWVLCGSFCIHYTFLHLQISKPSLYGAATTGRFNVLLRELDSNKMTALPPNELRLYGDTYVQCLMPKRWGHRHANSDSNITHVSDNVKYSIHMCCFMFWFLKCMMWKECKERHDRGNLGVAAGRGVQLAQEHVQRSMGLESEAEWVEREERLHSPWISIWNTEHTDESEFG